MDVINNSELRCTKKSIRYGIFGTSKSKKKRHIEIEVRKEIGEVDMGAIKIGKTSRAR